MGAIRPRLITFDAYSALFDYAGSLETRVREACGGRGDAPVLLRTWRAKQLEYAQLTNSLPGGRLAFRVVTRRALEYAFARAGVALSREDADRLVAAWDHLSPWPEAERVLAELKARGHVLAILSNGDEDMLRAAAEGLRTRPDFIFSSDQAGFYKPHPAIYALPTRALGIAPAEVLHVAGSGNDVLGAKLSGLACAWSNRAADRVVDPSVKADYEMPDLEGLLEIALEAPRRERVS